MKNLKLRRIDLGLSQYELAAASGLPRWKIQLIEAGIRTPTKNESEALCAILSCYREETQQNNQTNNGSEQK